ncbi:hypothetical protein FDA94_26475 [Herbidospora galbida]|uniref:Uncharacterized protein n=1 Tax=Herbidospora galbida TaxID=2575442 RepID=A0A4U3M9G3_9ACTN|nr:hypothetical protein [Herbidospora galbida]TKK85220.1 hypothetical protein FDA94_26475 [Herbidospora galbida]
MPAAYRRTLQHTDGETKAKEDAKQRSRAQKLRNEAVIRLAMHVACSPGLTPAQAAPLMAVTVVNRTCDASTMKTAVRWLRENGPHNDDPFIGDTKDDQDAYTYARKVNQSEDEKLALRLALTMTVAAQEQHLRFSNNGWDYKVVAYYERLMTEVGYEPTLWEQETLDYTRQQLDAKERLACLTCGCSHQRRPSSHWNCGVVQTDPANREWTYRCNTDCSADKARDMADDVDEDLDEDAEADLAQFGTGEIFTRESVAGPQEPVVEGCSGGLSPGRQGWDGDQHAL